MLKLGTNAAASLSLLLCALLLASWSRPASSPPQGDHVSSKSAYDSRHSEALHSGWARSSQYVAVRDGTRLAVDIYRPAVNGRAVDKPYPVVWMFTPYRRAFSGKGGKLVLAVQSPGSFANILNLTGYGYVVAAADVRGKGASYGTRLAFTSRTEAQDAYDLNEWLARQPWSDGKVGMVGCSYLGGTVLEAMTMMPPHLKAAFFGCTDFDKYDSWVQGGVVWKNWTNEIVDSPASVDLDALPVDQDKDRRMLKAAVAQHAGNTPQLQLFRGMPDRDSVSAVTHTQYWLQTSASSYLNRINRSGVAVYLFDGWNDPFRRDVILLFANLNTPKKLLLGPWSHCQTTGIDITAEEHRFFDYWLKGARNGAMSGLPVYYYTVNAQAGEQWQHSSQWPLPNAKAVRYFLGAGKSGSAKSTNDGTLGTAPPSGTTGRDSYTVDFDVSCSGPGWIAGPCPLDEKGLTYTTAPLPSPMEVSGFPVIHLWVSSTARDGNFFAYLEDVDARGNVHVVADGRLRASHRALRAAPYINLGLPWHRSFQRDLADLPPNKPVELVFSLLPTSQVFPAGDRIRVTVTGADPVAEPYPKGPQPPTMTVYRDAAHPSYIALPRVATSGRQ